MTAASRYRLRSAAVLAAAFALASTCTPSPRFPAGTPSPPPPFQRAPYLQAVVDGSAVVRWRASTPRPGTLRYRVGPGPWRRVRADAGPGGDRRVRLDSLPPSTRVEYRVTEGETAWPSHGFRTPPVDTSEAPVRVLAFGDSGWGGPAQLELAAQMRTGSWDLMLHVGDIAYDHGSEEELTLRHFRVYPGLLARAPFFPVPGNHDVRTDGGAPYARAFDWPGEESGRRYYAFRWGRVQFVGLDTSSQEARRRLAAGRGDQHRWLGATLDSAARDTTVRWMVVWQHHPLYSHGVGLSAHGPARELRETLEPLFLRHGVDLVLMGHEHHYERTRPLRRGSVVPAGCAPVYVITGGGGAKRFARDVRPDVHTARTSRDHHYLDLTVRARAIRGTAVRRDGSVLDRFEVTPYEPSAAREERCAA